MNVSNETTFSWANGWSLRVSPAYNSCKVSIMGPRQVFYSVSKDLKYMQPSADEAVDFLNTKGLTKLMLMIERMPASVMIEPFADEEAVIVDDMCKKCGGRIDNSDVCEDCGCNCSGASAAWEILNGRQVKRASCKSLVLDDSDNQFNSMQS